MKIEEGKELIGIVGNGETKRGEDSANDDKGSDKVGR